MSKKTSENPCYVTRNVVVDAVKALRQNLEDYADKPRSRGGKLQLLDEDEMFFITLALQKAPTHAYWKPDRMFVFFFTYINIPSMIHLLLI